MNLNRMLAAALVAAGGIGSLATDVPSVEAIAPREVLHLLNDSPDCLAQFDSWIAGQGLNNDTHRVFRIEKDADGRPLLRVTGDGYGGLITRRSYRDYRLVIEFRWTGPASGARLKKARDNGLLLHCTGRPGNLMMGTQTRPPAKFESPWMKSIELQVIEGGVGDLLVLGGWKEDGTRWPTTIHARYGLDRDGETVFDARAELRPFEAFRLNWWGRDPDWKDDIGYRGREDLESPSNEWTRVEADVRGGDFTYWVNGRLANEARDCSMTEGRILIQTEGAEIVYRRIDLEPLPSPGPDAVQAAAPASYTALWSDPAIAGRIDRGIEQHRRRDVTLEAFGADGKPLANATIEVRQRTQEFLFGCNLFALGQLESPELNARYEAAFAGIFNFATLPFYWKELEPAEGRPRFAADSPPIWRRPPPDVLLAWCKARGIAPKGHALMYVKNMFMPDWTARNDPEALRRQGARHMAEIAARYARDIGIWDVVNEEMPRLAHPQEWPAVPSDYLPWCFREADRLFPRPTVLMINDGTSQAHETTEAYAALVKGLQDTGARVDGVGLQFHAYNRSAMLAGKSLPPARLAAAYDRLGQLSLPLYITEITIPASGPDGPAQQAAIVANLFRLWFATPQMAGATWWNLGDGTAYGNENQAMGGLLDAAMLPKPAYRTLDRLVNHEWKTRLTLRTDGEGRAAFRGFHGAYTLRLTAGGEAREFPFDLKPGPDTTRKRLEMGR